MKKRIISVSICLLCVAFLLSACGANDGGEAKAKKLGLNYIKKAFQMEETEELKEYFENAQVMPLANGGVSQSSKKKFTFFSVTVNDDQGKMLYYTVVNIKTRKMMTLEQSPSNLKLTEEEEEMATNMASSSIFEASVKNEVPKRASDRAALWVQQVFEPSSKVTGASAGQAYEKKDVSARAFFDSTIMMDSGSVYGVTVCWPSMDVVQVTLLD